MKKVLEETHPWPSEVPECHCTRIFHHHWAAKCPARSQSVTLARAKRIPADPAMWTEEETQTCRAVCFSWRFLWIICAETTVHMVTGASLEADHPPQPVG